MNPTEAFDKLTEKLQAWFEGLVLTLPNLIAATLILVVFWFLAKFARQLVAGLSARLIGSVQIRKLFATLVYILVLAAGAFVGLGVVGLDKTVTSLLAGAGLVGLALAFAFQDIAANFVSGILISIRRPFSIDDIVETNDYFGTVTDINLRSTELRTPQGQMVIIPNKMVFENPIKNFSRSGERRIDLEVGVSYGDDLALARQLTIEAVEAVPTRNPDREVQLFYQEFGSSSINFVVRFWVPYRRQPDYLDARSEAIMRIKAAFDRGGITIPFPIRTLDFGIVGGETLAQQLAPRKNGAGQERATPD